MITVNLKLRQPTRTTNLRVWGEEWYKNGKPAEIATYKEGNPEGLLERWYDNGKPYEIATYKDGKLNGLNESWYRKGQPKLAATYKK